MPHKIYKTASVRVKNLDDFVEILSKHNLKAVPDGTNSAKDVAEHIVYGRGGTGSLLIDGAGYLVKKTPFIGKKIHGATVGNYKKLQRHIADFDIEAGNKIQNALDKTKASDRVKNLFSYEHKVNLADSPDGVPDKVLKVKVPMLSAPIEKSKKAILPFAGAMYVGDQLIKMDNKKESPEGGDTVSKNAFTREELIEKIANILSPEQSAPETANTGMNKTASELMAKASSMLKVAAERERELLDHNEKLAYENQSLQAKVYELENKDKATKLAQLMNEKGMIKKAEVESKALEIMSLDKDAYSMLKQATENVQIKNEKDGVDSLTFLTGEYNIKGSNTKRTLADAIEDAAR
jgi:hypothetical protein